MSDRDRTPVTDWTPEDFFAYIYELPKEQFVPDARFWLVLGMLVGRLVAAEDELRRRRSVQ